jgi:hypothetical protein
MSADGPMIESMPELKERVQALLDGLPAPVHQTDYARGRATALNEVIRLLSPEPRTAETVASECVGDESARVVVRRLRQEGFLIEPDMTESDGEPTG